MLSVVIFFSSLITQDIEYTEAVLRVRMPAGALKLTSPLSPCSPWLSFFFLSFTTENTEHTEEMRGSLEERLRLVPSPLSVRSPCSPCSLWLKFSSLSFSTESAEDPAGGGTSTRRMRQARKGSDAAGFGCPVSEEPLRHYAPAGPDPRARRWRARSKASWTASSGSAARWMDWSSIPSRITRQVARPTAGTPSRSAKASSVSVP